MIYGRSYEGNADHCRNCGHFTNVHVTCPACNKPRCEACTDNDGICADCVAFATELELSTVRRDLAAARKPVTVAASIGSQWILERTAPYFASIGNGLFVRTGNGRKRARR